MKRIFYTYGRQKDAPRRGCFDYKTRQYLIAVNGSCKVTLDNGEAKQTFVLDQSNKGLFQDALIWGGMHDFPDDCVLLVFSSKYYRDTNYIRDYKNFETIVGKK